MQEKIKRQTNKARTKQTKSALKVAARALFLEKGFSATGTQEIVRNANVTRGALYHHYDDKRGLFRDLVEDEFSAVALQIDNSSRDANDPLEALKQGSNAFISAMANNGRTKLVLVEAPAILGRDAVRTIEDRYTRKTLRVGLSEAMNAGCISAQPLDALIEIMNAIFDSAALNIEAGIASKDIISVVHAILDGLATSNERKSSS